MCVIWFIIHIESHGRVNPSPDRVRQMWYMNMRVVVMVWARAGGGGGRGVYGPCSIATLSVKFLIPGVTRVTSDPPCFL